MVLTEISQLLSLKFVQRSMVIGSDRFVVLDLATNIQGPSRINSNNFGYNLFSLDCHIFSSYILSGNNRTTDADLMTGVNHAFPRAITL